MKSEYELQAEKFLADCGITFEAKFLFHGPYWTDEKETRDVYSLILKRSGKIFETRFGNSIAHSGGDYRKKVGGVWRFGRYPRRAPHAYDLLTCLTKYHPGTFEDFCSEYGLDADSRKAFDTYQNVLKEWGEVSRFFTSDEIEKLGEIQ